MSAPTENAAFCRRHALMARRSACDISRSADERMHWLEREILWGLIADAHERYDRAQDFTDYHNRSFHG